MNLKPRSLFGQLTLAQALIAIIIATTAPLLLSHLLRRTADEFVAARVHHETLRLAEMVTYDKAGWHLDLPLLPQARGSGPHTDRGFALLDDQGGLAAMDRRTFAIDLTRMPRGAQERHLHIGNIEVNSLPLDQNGHRAWLITAQDRRPSEQMVDQVIGSFLSRFIWIVPAIILLSLLLMAVVTRLTTRAVARVAGHAEQINEERPELRLDPAKLPTEVRSLAIAANRAFDRIYGAYEQQSRFAADVAHELRTPLSTLSCRASTIKGSALRSQLLRPIGQASHIIDQLLELARLQNDTGSRTRVDLHTLACEAVAAAAPAVFQGGRTIALDGAGETVSAYASEGLVRIALGNLIENAARHTPMGTNIVVRIGNDGALCVEDDGPGIRPIKASKLHGRFWRADAQRSDGAGLGLSIVARIMVTLDGQLDIGNRPSGGARMVLRFAQPSPAPKHPAAA